MYATCQVGPALGGLLFSRSAWSLADIIALSGWASVLGAFLCLFLIAPSKLEAYNNAPQVTPDGEPAINSAPMPLFTFYDPNEETRAIVQRSRRRCRFVYEP
jgi:hypothetical protein